MSIDFDKGNGLVPAIIQDRDTNRVLMLGYMNQEALEVTQKSGLVTFYSRTKQRLWTKGESSGNTLTLHEIIVDCDQDTLLIKATPSGPVCHTGAETCFNESDTKGFLYELERTIAARVAENSNESYTASLLRKGINKVAQKVGEEAVEVVIEAKDSNEALFQNEVADLLFHLLVLLRAKETDLSEIEKILRDRSR